MMVTLRVNPYSTTTTSSLGLLAVKAGPFSGHAHFHHGKLERVITVLYIGPGNEATICPSPTSFGSNETRGRKRSCGQG